MAKLNAVIISIFLAVVTAFSALVRMWFITHLCVLLIGMILGAILKGEQEEIDNWSRKKIKEAGL